MLLALYEAQGDVILNLIDRADLFDEVSAVRLPGNPAVAITPPSMYV